jgi:hypothetical protein
MSVRQSPSGLPLRDAVVVIAARETRDAPVRGTDGLMYRVYVELMGARCTPPPTSASWLDAAAGEGPTGSDPGADP